MSERDLLAVGLTAGNDGVLHAPSGQGRDVGGGVRVRNSLMT
jgi:hypothetical protein